MVKLTLTLQESGELLAAADYRAEEFRTGQRTHVSGRQRAAFFRAYEKLLNARHKAIVNG